MSLAPRLMDVPMVGLYPMPITDANRLLVEWQHRLGPCNRPFHQEAFALEYNQKPIAVAVSASIVNGPVGASYYDSKEKVWRTPFKDHPDGYQREETVELARQAAAVPWANRIMLRLWRECCAQVWPCWPVKAAVSYSHNGMHRGDMYRMDGWEKVREDAGASKGGGSWARQRYATEAVVGKKTLWVFRYKSKGGLVILEKLP